MGCYCLVIILKMSGLGSKMAAELGQQDGGEADGAWATRLRRVPWHPVLPPRSLAAILLPSAIWVLAVSNLLLRQNVLPARAPATFSSPRNKKYSITIVHHCQGYSMCTCGSLSGGGR